MNKILHKPYSVTVKIAKKIVDVDNILIENGNLKSENKIINEKLRTYESAQSFGWPNGHYYSPVHEEIDLTFIEPYPELLYERMHKEDKSRYNIIQKGVQKVPLDIFKTLKKNDILFIDSTHVSKFNSDVNYEIFNILPIISKGVIIHIHDIHDGFEYPLDWLKLGWAWNEAY